jgi:hypothetical protein
MNKKIMKILVTISFLIFHLIFVACNPKAMNDFFGIQMDPQFIDQFEIVSYSEKEGAKYKSNTSMNPAVYAYAEYSPKSIHIKIANFGQTQIALNYNLDHFYLYMDNEKIGISAGKREKYNALKAVRVNEFVEFDLELPLNLIDTVGKTNPLMQGTDRPVEFWDGQTTSHIIKESIKYIELNFGNQTTIILKPIPK